MGKFVRERDGGRGRQTGASKRSQRCGDGFPRAALAETTGIELGQLVAAESGDSLITEHELAAIAQALTASFEALDAPAAPDAGTAVPASTIRKAMHSIRARYLARLDHQQSKRAV